jgi:hypothetical protein
LGRVRTGLDSIRAMVRTEGSANDVVMIYWRGKDAVRDSRGAWYLPTSNSSRRRPSKETDVALDDLLGVNESVPGARILLLDAEAAPARRRSLPREVARAHAGVVYYAWSQADEPLRGLLLAVEKAVARRPVSLQDVVRAAEDWSRSHPTALRVEHNLDGGRPLAAVVLTEARPPLRSP